MSRAPPLFGGNGTGGFRSPGLLPVAPADGWTWAKALGLMGVLALLAGLAAAQPTGLWARVGGVAASGLGGLALWRYGWWLTHAIRAQIYAHVVYPRLKGHADAIWDAGWRPERVHILLTTYRERPATAEAVVRALCRNIGLVGRPATIWLGSREAADEAVFARHLALVAGDLDIELRIIRQREPGKRAALGLALRAMARRGLGTRDLVAFMDSDFVLADDALRRCLPLFAADPSLQAVTTDEHVIVEGPAWVRSWLEMRFAQRRLTMQSHAVSGGVLTLTGRFSVLRASHITREPFIRLVEADHLDHWLWGRFRFLSGDDKSTWYAILSTGDARMLYVPDAGGTTVEVFDDAPVARMRENLLRWSGNMLRNGSRALALGPRRMPLFIWWCLLDQRLAMWTMMFGPMLALVGTLAMGPGFLLAYLVYIAATRTALALVLFSYAGRVDLNFIWCLYVNQIANAAVKIYLTWRLPRQRWLNRGDQRLGGGGAGFAAALRGMMAGYLTLLSLAGLLLAALWATSAVALPGADFLDAMLTHWGWQR